MKKKMESNMIPRERLKRTHGLKRKWDHTPIPTGVPARAEDRNKYGIKYDSAGGPKRAEDRKEKRREKKTVCKGATKRESRSSDRLFLF